MQLFKCESKFAVKRKRWQNKRCKKKRKFQINSSRCFRPNLSTTLPTLLSSLSYHRFLTFFVSPISQSSVSPFRSFRLVSFKRTHANWTFHTSSSFFLFFLPFTHIQAFWHSPLSYRSSIIHDVHIYTYIHIHIFASNSHTLSVRRRTPCLPACLSACPFSFHPSLQNSREPYVVPFLFPSPHPDILINEGTLW